MLKIAIMGPESTGKSAISSFLARYYNTVWVPEYARKYCEGLDHLPTMTDELNMLRGQLALEDQVINKANHLVFCDTMFLTVKIWSEFEFKTYPAEVDTELLTRSYDFFLIMNIDLPWQDDPLRNFPDLREHFMKVHINEVRSLGKPYAIISGFGVEREENAIKAVEAFLNT